MDPYDKLITYLYNNIYIYGNIYTDYERRCTHKFIKAYMCRLGSPYKETPINEEDFYTGKHIRVIPEVYRFTFKASNGVLIADIRSLMDYTGDLLTNPYTSDEIQPEDQVRYTRQLKLLRNFNWFTSHNISPGELTLEQQTVNAFSDLSQHHYVDYNWFIALTATDLKNLYLGLHDLWSIRLELQADQKRKIAPSLGPDLNLCPNHRAVKLYTDDMSHILRTELLHVLKLLLSSADNTVRKEGGLYFLLGLVMVSPCAAGAYPILHNAVA